MQQNIYLTSLTEPEKQTLLNAWKDVMSIADSHQHASDELRKLVSQFPITAVEKVASNLDIRNGRHLSARSLITITRIHRI